MKTYIVLSFAFGVFSLLCRVIEIYAGRLPRTVDRTMGNAVAEFLLGLGFVVWAGILLFP